MNFHIFTLSCFIFCSEKQTGTFEYSSCLSNNGKYERGCEYFLKDLNKRIQELYVANPRKRNIKTFELIIFGVTSNIMTSFIKNDLPCFTKNTKNTYQCSYIKCLKKKHELKNSKINMLGRIIAQNINENKNYCGDYNFKIFGHKFNIRNEKMNDSNSLDIEKSIHTESKEKDDDQKELESDELMTCPDFFMINDGKADAKDLYNIKKNLEPKLNWQICKPAKLFRDLFRNFYENEHYLFRSITNDLFVRELFFKHESSNEIFDLKYDDIKDKIFENFNVNYTVIDNEDRSYYAYLEDVFSSKDTFNSIFDKYIKEQDWNDYLDKLRSAQKVIDYDINYIIILSGSDLGDKVKKCLYKTLYDKINIDLLLEIDFFLCEVVGEIKKDNDSVAFSNLTDTKINTSENPKKIEDKVDNEISIKWNEIEIRENDYAGPYNKNATLDKYTDLVFLEIDCKNFKLEIYTRRRYLVLSFEHIKGDEIISYCFIVYRNYEELNEFTLSVETQYDCKKRLSDLDAKTYILSIIKIFINESLDMVLSVLQRDKYQVYKAFSYDSDLERKVIRKVEGKLDFIHREAYYKAFFDNLNSLNIEGFQLEDNLMITDKGLVFNIYSFKKTILNSTLEFFNHNEVIALDIKEKNYYTSLKANKSSSEPISLSFEMQKNEYSVKNKSYMDTVLIFKRGESESNIKVIMRLECFEKFEDNRLIKDIVKIFDAYNVDLTRNYENQVLWDFLSDLSKKKVYTWFADSSTEISQIIYDKKMTKSVKLNKIVGILCKKLYIRGFKIFVRDKGYKDLKLINEAYKTIINDILPNLRKFLNEKIENILESDAEEHKDGSCVFKITLFKDDKQKSEDFEYLVSKISEWAVKIRF